MSTATTGRQLLDELEKRVAELERKVKEFEGESSLIQRFSRQNQEDQPNG